jgi:hypothetical protein
VFVWAGGGADWVVTVCVDVVVVVSVWVGVVCELVSVGAALTGVLL